LGPFVVEEVLAAPDAVIVLVDGHYVELELFIV